jgi:hypothetical protein
MNTLEIKVDDFNRLVERLTDADEDEPIFVGSSEHKEETKEILEDFFRVERAYTVTVKITEEHTYSTLAFDESHAEEKVYNRWSDENDPEVELIDKSDPEETTVETWETAVLKTHLKKANAETVSKLTQEIAT